LLALFLVGAAAPLPQVEVVQPASREVSDYEVFTGRTEASATVQLRARVTGYLTRVHFKNGAEVKRGDVLFEIDSRPYKAELDKAEAALTLAEARLKKADAAGREEARARVRVARAARELARLNLAFTRVTAPLSGRMGRPLDAGNVAKADETTLATLTSSKPIYAYFDIDERTALRLRREGLSGKLEAAVGLADEKGFPRQAVVDFLNGRVDPKTGTLRLRAALPNADGLLLPGLFVRVRLTTGKPRKALLVPERALKKHRKTSFVFVVNAKDQLEVREVRLGLRHADQVVVKEGLGAAERVVLTGPHGLRAGMTVKPRKAPSADELYRRAR
jgi:multidrug efflux pump subunit AcrA (membrane-fusion protein)